MTTVLVTGEPAMSGVRSSPISSTPASPSARSRVACFPAAVQLVTAAADGLEAIPLDLGR
jgi:hypothetical protein